jgi:endogenous inhibitor of DNA gyrase (YacG/DUF329 family)
MTCPICERDFDPASPTAAKPFCSERCRLIDLGRWLGEGYSLPAERRADADELPDEPAESAGRA